MNFENMGFKAFYEIPDGGGGDGNAAPSGDGLREATAAFAAELKGTPPTVPQGGQPAAKVAGKPSGVVPQGGLPVEDPEIDLGNGVKIKRSVLLADQQVKGRWHEHWQSTSKRQQNELRAQLQRELVGQPVAQVGQLIEQRLAPVLEAFKQLEPLLKTQNIPQGAAQNQPAVGTIPPDSPQAALDQFRTGIVKELGDLVRQTVQQVANPLLGEQKASAMQAVNEAIQVYEAAGDLPGLREALVSNGIVPKVNPQTKQLEFSDDIPPFKIRDVCQRAIAQKQKSEQELVTHITWGNEAFTTLGVDPKNPAMQVPLTLFTQAWNAAITDNQPASKELAAHIASECITHMDQMLQQWQTYRDKKIASAEGGERKLTTPNAPPAAQPKKKGRDEAMDKATAGFAAALKATPH